MCGVAGMVAPQGATVDGSAVRRMARTLRARGPDDEGFYDSGPCGLGHRRLSIVDLTGGRQPLDGQGVVAVVNGEIYNFRQLRKELEQHGCRFRTDSDSEVVAHGYRVWKDELPARLQGMFAFAAWSVEDETLLLARDRAGQKPLYFGVKQGFFLFGSELKALLVAPCPEGVREDRWRFDLDRRAVATYLALECLPEDLSPFRGVHKLRPGEQLSFRRQTGTYTRKRYWSPGFSSLEAEPADGDWSRPLESAVLASVERRLMADVPIGVLLSGGIDSSVVAAAVAKLRPPGQVQTFSIGFDDPSFDESPFAAQVARYLGTDHRMEKVSPSAMQDVLPEVADYMDEPLGDASIFPTYLLCRFVRSHVKVALGGDGGDELFLGYPTFIAERVARRIPPLLGRPLGSVLGTAARFMPAGSGYFPLDFKVKRFARGLGFAPGERHLRWLGSFSPNEASAVLAGQPTPKQIRADLLRLLGSVAPAEARDDHDRLTAQYMALYLAGDVLTKVDRASMAHGLEVRAPFLDRELMEFAFGIPGKDKLHGGVPKAVLKRLAHRWLPPEVVDRKKQGFAVPMARWLRGPLRPLGEELLAPVRLAREGLFEPAPIRALWTEHQSGRADHRKPLWTLMAFQLWFERYARSHSSMRWAA